MTKVSKLAAVGQTSSSIDKEIPVTAASGTPEPEEVGMGPDAWVTEQQALLLQEREIHVRQAENLKAEADALAEEMEPGDVQFDEESGEGGTMNVERERDLALSAQARAAVEEIDRALAKITTGTYGICERCGKPIPRVRLEAIPQASLCVDCKSGGLLGR